MSDAATVNARGEQTVPSALCKAVLTTKDPMEKVIRYYEAKLKPAADPLPENREDEPATVSGRSVMCHDDPENRPLAIQVILVNTDKSSSTLVISRAETESETHIARTRYVRL